MNWEIFCTLSFLWFLRSTSFLTVFNLWLFLKLYYNIPIFTIKQLSEAQGLSKWRWVCKINYYRPTVTIQKFLKKCISGLWTGKLVVRTDVLQRKHSWQFNFFVLGFTRKMGKNITAVKISQYIVLKIFLIFHKFCHSKFLPRFVSPPQITTVSLVKSLSILKQKTEQMLTS